MTPRMPVYDSVDHRLPDLSVAILAGGQSSRMGSDKAFLTYNGVPFIRLIAEKMKLLTDDMLAIVGKKPRTDFEAVLGDNVKVVNDSYHLENPLGGLATALHHSDRPYIAFIACDLPMVRMEVVKLLYSITRSKSAAVPRWDTGRIEPLCAVYDRNQLVEMLPQITEACSGLVKGGCKRMLTMLSDVEYVGVDRLRILDPGLDSFMNINQREDYELLVEGEAACSAPARVPIRLR